MNTTLRVFGTIFILLIIVSTGYSNDDLGPLLRRLPATANTVVVINVKAIRQLSGDKPDAARSQIIAGAIVPPSVDLVVFATHLEPGALETRKTIGLIQLNHPVTLDDLMDKTGGQTVDLGGESAIVHPRKGFYVMLAPNLIGIGRNVSRQDVVRGLKFARTNDKVVLPECLTSAIASAADAPIFGALDLEHSLEVQTVRGRLAASDLMAGRDKAEIDAIGSLVAGVKGVVLTVDGPQLDRCELRLDFSTAVGDRGEMIKSLFLQTLEDLGASLNDFEKAKVVTADKTVKLQVKLSGEGLIRIMSIFMPPAPEPQSRSAAPKLEANGASIDVTRRYYQAIDPMLRDLRRRTQTATDYPRTATWHDSYASSIENMSTRYVDPDMVKFGQTVATRLRAISASLRGVAVNVDALQSGLTYIAAGTGSIFGGSSIAVDSNIAQTRTRQAEMIRKDANRRLEIWDSIDKDQRNLVKLMRERFNLNLEITN